MKARSAAETPCATPWPGYAEAKPMVFSGLYPTENDQYNDLLDALQKLSLIHISEPTRPY